MAKQGKAQLRQRARALRAEADRLRLMQGGSAGGLKSDPHGVRRLLAEAQELERQAEQLKR